MFNELKPDLEIDPDHVPYVQMYLQVSMLAELHTIRLQLNELLHRASSDPSDDRAGRLIASRFAGIHDNQVVQIKKHLTTFWGPHQSEL